jgi:hypothetical protein
MNAFPNMARPATGLEAAAGAARPQCDFPSVFGYEWELVTTPRTNKNERQ